MKISNENQIIGNTPIICLKQLTNGLEANIFVKLESANPGGSIKDRIGKAMIEDAERRGKLRAGGTIVEATAGNTGIGLAMTAISRGYKMIFVIPDKMSSEKIDLLRSLGAEIIITRSDVTHEHEEYYSNMAKSIADESENSFYVNQFGNPANPRTHYETTAPEIWKQTNGKIDALVAGVGTGGTISGCGKYLKEKNEHIEIILADPVGSVLDAYVNKKKPGDAGSYLVEGIGEDYIPKTLDISVIDRSYSISDKESFETARRLLREEGIFAGTSSGTLVAAAIRYAKEQRGTKNIVTFICDTGRNYMNKLYNKKWLKKNNLWSEL